MNWCNVGRMEKIFKKFKTPSKIKKIQFIQSLLISLPISKGKKMRKKVILIVILCCTSISVHHAHTELFCLQEFECSYFMIAVKIADA